MVRSRIAPTPSGYLHLGNAVNFVLTWLLVRRSNGTLLLRIDDLDAPRMRPEYADDIFRTLEWLGIDWDEGPHSPDELKRTFSQLLRIERYKALIEKLEETGRAYACNCSRKELQKHGLYPGFCRQKHLPLDAMEIALRIMVPEKTHVSLKELYANETTVSLEKEMGDFIICRRDGIPAYQVASLVDDYDFKINLIVRGQDLRSSSAAQMYLASLCEYKEFENVIFYHHALIKDEGGNKLSKSAGSASLKAWREGKRNPQEFYLMLSKLLGWEDTAGSANEMLKAVKAGQPCIFQ